MINKKVDTAIRVLREMSFNYKNQYPEEIPDMHLVVGLVKGEIPDD